MGNITGFMDYERKGFTYRDASERLSNYNEFVIMQPEEELRKQGARCMDCGVPYCHAMGCPVYNLIPEWNDLVYRGKWREAYERLELTNNLPEITGRICPAPCETSCTLSINTSPVTIKQIELAIIETAFERGWVRPIPPRTKTNKKVAIIGSGPAGLAAAQQLARAGHTVVVFEKSNKPGGILRYGIPDYKLGKSVLDRRLEILGEEGVKFETDVNVGEDVSYRYVKKSFDCILLALGAGEPRDLQFPSRGHEGIHFAMDYLTLSNRRIAGEIDEQKVISAKDKTVLVLGGGDTGADCVGTANRQGAKIVRQFEILPKPREWKEAHNPEWPSWPNILRTASSHEEGCERDWSVSTTRFSGTGIKVSKAHCTRVEWEKDKRTGNWKMANVPGSEFAVDADMVLLALGFLHVKHSRLLDEMQCVFDERGNIKLGPDYATSVPGVYAAGDSHTGASLVVRAIWHGRQAAEAINKYLNNE
jgi:glutamate synthase (NADPH/NADH) small chain